ncbi:HTH-type transcriptional regulator DmlR [compost metagenome]
MAMDTLVSMQVFRLVAELKSFVAAANRMNVPPAMASKHVMHLEKRLGARLLNRTSRSVSLTEVGQLYFDQARQMLEALEEVEGAVTNAVVMPKGLLRVSAPVWVASKSFVNALASFRQSYPDVRLEIDLSGRLVNLVEEGFDLALRVSQSPGDHLVAREIASVSFQLVASPGYVEGAGMPGGLADLQDHALLWYSGMPTDTSAFPPGLKQADVAVKLVPVLSSANETLLHLAALQGMGIALLPTWLIAEDISDGRLVKILSGSSTLSHPLLAVYPSRKYLSSKVRTFIDFLAKNECINGA